MVDTPQKKKIFTVQEAADYLGVSRVKISKMLRNRILTSEINLLDTREKLITLEQLERLKDFPPAGRRTENEDQPPKDR